MKLNPQKIKEYLRVPADVLLYDSIDSTNNEAKRCFDPDSGIRLYAAAHQTDGRGRHGHSFYSPKDTGLYMTLSFPLSRATANVPAHVQKITCAAAVAVCGAITALSVHHPLIKWVNDIYVNGKKTAGILTELITDSQNRPQAVIIGIGLNLCTEAFPDEFAQTAGNLGDIDVNALCGTIAQNLIDCTQRLDNHSVLEKYKQLNLCIGRTVRYTKDAITHTAKAVDIDDDGGLVVEENGVRTTLNAGEISIIPLSY